MSTKPAFRGFAMKLMALFTMGRLRLADQQRRGKELRFPQRFDVMRRKMPRSRFGKPHQGPREIARRLRGCNPEPIPCRKWLVHSAFDYAVYQFSKSRTELVHMAKKQRVYLPYFTLG